MLTTPEIIDARKNAAVLIKECLHGSLIVREALKQWPDFKDDLTLMCARHAIIHYAADEDLRKKDRAFADQQIQWLEELINILSSGEAIPKNILETYEEYYEMPVSIKSRIVSHIVYAIYLVKQGLIKFRLLKQNNS